MKRGAGFLWVALASVASCSEPPVAYGPDVRPGIIQFYGYEPGDVINLPDAVAAGRRVTFQVRTYGDGCTTAVDADVGTSTGRNVVLTIRPFDERPPGPCTAQLTRPVHSVTFAFPIRGIARIRVEGRRVAEGVDQPVVLEKFLRVE